MKVRAEAGDGWLTFQEVVDGLKQEGWKNLLLGGQWKNVCPECQEADK